MHPTNQDSQPRVVASLGGMTEPHDYAGWVAHFEANEVVHAAADAAIDFTAPAAPASATRTALIGSVQRFQLGESGDGAHLLRKAARAGDPDYSRAAQLFVAEEQQHAALLLRLLGHLGGEPLRQHWSDAVFVRLRRLMGLRTELMILMIAEVVALSYYGALARRGPDATVRAVAARILDDEVAHVRFHTMRLRAGFTGSRTAVRVLAQVLWLGTAVGATAAVAFDHRAALRALDYRPARFATDVLRDVVRVTRSVLAVNA